MTAEEKPSFDQRLDLLIDGELSPEGRAKIIAELADEPPGLARDMAVRFLQHQAERETVKKLMAGGRVVPVELVEKPSTTSAPLARIGWHLRATLGTAAGLLIMVGGGIAYYTLRPAQAAEMKVSLPAEAVSYNESITLHVPVLNVKNSPDLFTPADDPHVSKQSWVITPDGRGNATAVPVNTLKAAVE